MTAFVDILLTRLATQDVLINVLIVNKVFAQKVLKKMVILCQHVLKW